jgi:C-methyltransferase C-terminal domain/Methyltransferase domain
MLINHSDISADLEIFFSMLDVPVYCNHLWRSPEAARNCPKGDIKLAFDKRTGAIVNVAFDPAKLDYNIDYENSLHYSPRFQEYAQSLANDLVERHRLDGKTIIEVGCGKGDFLVSLCALGNNRGIGFDPTYVPRPEHQPIADRVTFIQDYYSERYQNYQADLIVCRHTLEHIPNPAELLKPLRRAIGDRLETAVFFEVPNGLDTFRRLAIWDIIYEHCCYYIPSSLVQAFASHGFQVQQVYETYEGQFLCLEALPISEEQANIEVPEKEIETLRSDLDSFTLRFQAKIADWEQNLSQIAAKGQRAVVWGAGSKGVTFLNILKNQSVIEYIVDLNPRKQGKYLPGTGQKIVPSEFLRQYQPDVVIVMNPIYRDEIGQMLADMGCKSDLICV